MFGLHFDKGVPSEWTKCEQWRFVSGVSKLQAINTMDIAYDVMKSTSWEQVPSASQEARLCG